jgi:hypothetical protein
MRLLFRTHIQSVLHLLVMHLIQILQQHISVPLFPLVPTHIIAPATYCTGQATRYVWFFANVGDWMEVCSDSEDYAARTRESEQKESVGVFETMTKAGF